MSLDAQAVLQSTIRPNGITAGRSEPGRGGPMLVGKRRPIMVAGDTTLPILTPRWREGSKPKSLRETQADSARRRARCLRRRANLQAGADPPRRRCRRTHRGAISPRPGPHQALPSSCERDLAAASGGPRRDPVKDERRGPFASRRSTPCPHRP
jgi:hypothetical protein